jgi:hypothetical protein
MANLTVYLLKVSNSRRVYRHLRYPGNCEDEITIRYTAFEIRFQFSLAWVVTLCTGVVPVHLLLPSVPAGAGLLRHQLHRGGTAVQADPMKPMLKPPVTEH